MKIKIPLKLQKIVRDAIKDYKWELGMLHYESNIIWDSVDADHSDGMWTQASADVDHRYLTANFKIYPCLVEDWKKKKKSDEDVKEIIAHEVAHMATHTLHYIATCPYKDEGETKDAWESLTTIVGRLIYRLNQNK